MTEQQKFEAWANAKFGPAPGVIPQHERYASLFEVWQARAAQDNSAEWQPIETAPKDGSRILIYTPEASRQTVQEAYWSGPYEGAADNQCRWRTPHGPAGFGYMILPEDVTHWMPLPPPPKGQE